MRLSRHARNEMRLYGIEQADVQATINEPATRELDDRGNARPTGETADGRLSLSLSPGMIRIS